MAAKTWFATNTLVSNHQQLSETSPGANATSSPATGWTVGTTAPTVYSEFDGGTKQANGTFSATARPDGSINTAGDCLRTANQYLGSFANANWTITFSVIGVTNSGAQDGRARVRLFRSANADGSSATEITGAAQLGSNVVNLSTTQQDSAVTFNPGAFSLTNEYLFVQVGWEIQGAGGMSTTDVVMRIGTTATRVVSSDFIEIKPGDGASSFTVTTSGTGSSTAESDGASAAALAVASVGTGIVAAVGASSFAITVAGVGDTVQPAALLAEYFITEASSGQTPTQVLDSEASPEHLDITYVGSNPAYTSDSEGRGLNFTTLDDDTVGAFSEALDAGNKIFDALDSATKATLVVKASVPTEILSGTGSEITFLFGICRFDGENDVLLIWHDRQVGPNGVFEVDSTGSGGYAHHRYDNVTSGMHVFHVVYDSTQSTAVDRMKFYMDGSLLTSYDPVTTVGANSTLDIPTATAHHVLLGGCPDFLFVGGGWKGAIKYAAIYDGALTSSEVSASATALAANDDPEATAGDGVSALAVTVAGVGASTAAADSVSAAALTAVGTGASTAEAAGTSSFAVTAAATGSSTAAADGLSAFAITAVAEGAEAGGGVEEGVSASSLAVTASAQGASTAAADGTSSVTLAAAGVGAATAASAGVSSETVSVAGTGGSTAAASVLSACTVTVAGVGASTAAATSASSAVITVLGAGSANGVQSGNGVCSIACTVAGVGSSTAAATGACTLAVTASGVGTGVSAAIGQSSCTVTVAGVGATIAAGVSSSALAVNGATAGSATAAATSVASLVVIGATVSGSVIPPDPPIATGWHKEANRPSATAWAKESGRPLVTTWIKNEAEEFWLPMAA